MARYEDDPDLDDRELPDESDRDDAADEGYAEVTACPYCERPLYEQAELCPHCRNYISREDAPNRKQIWFVIGVVACLLIMLVWIL